MEIHDNNSDDERRVQQRQDQAKIEQKRREQNQPMRTFEAKLSEKASHESALRDAAVKSQKTKQEEAKDRQSLLDKIIGSTARDKDALVDKSRVHEKKFQDQKESEHRDELRSDDLRESARETSEIDQDQDVGAEPQKKDGETSVEGYRRVADKGGQDESGSGGFFGGGEGQSESSMGGDAMGGDAPQSGMGSGQKKSGEFTVKKRGEGAVVATQGAGAQRGFQQNARAFTQKDLDGIVTKAQAGITRGGEEFFSVELTDEYFDGLKLRAVRSPQGVILQFQCPNLSVRSTFIKYRPAVYAQLKAKNISVFRIDVV